MRRSSPAKKPGKSRIIGDNPEFMTLRVAGGGGCSGQKLDVLVGQAYGGDRCSVPRVLLLHVLRQARAVADVQ